jgi:2-methylisocitrate lyase-like PEP mutase family enzyme
MQYGPALRDAIQSPGTTPLIGIYDMYSASIAAQHYDGFFVSGFGFAASHYGLPDIGFIAWPDMVEFTERLRLAFPGHHLLVDIDDGYVDPEVACHVVQRLERAGASGVILEDQKRPRRCGHAEGKQILPLEEYLEKLNLVLASRQDMIVVARTDATEESGISRIRSVVGSKPLLFNQIAGGKSPRLSLSELSELQVDVAIYSTPCLFAAHSAIDSALLELKAADGRLAATEHSGGVGVRAATELLEKNISRHHERRDRVSVR